MDVALIVGLIVVGVGFIVYQVMRDNNMGPFKDSGSSGGRVIDGPDDNDPFARPE